MAYPTPAPQVPRYVLEERQGVIDSIVGGILGDGSSSNGGSGDSGSSGSGSSDSGSGSSDNGSGSSDNSSGDSTAGSSGNSGDSSSTDSSTSASESSTAQSSTVSTTESAAATASSASGNDVVTVTSTSNGSNVVVVQQSTSTPTSSASGTSANDAASSSSSSSGGLIGGVVGGVVGGLVLITAIILLVVVWRRRRSRTGHGWFLCFGTRPKRGDKDLDVDWPTFDPVVGAAGVGGTMGSQSGRRRNRAGAHGGTLPDVDDDGYYRNEDEMRDVNSGTHHSHSYNNSGQYYAGGPTSQNGYSVGHKGPSTHNGPSDEGHYRNGGWAAMPMGAAAAAGGGGHGERDGQDADDSAPTYDHLDPPEVREARAREQAEAQAQAQAAAYGRPNSPPAQAPPYYPSSSPPPVDTQRPQSDHRLSSGTTQALAANQYFDADSGTMHPVDQQRMLHLHNPDA